MKPWYLSGPMTGRPQFNFPAFRSATYDLRAQGLEIISPAEEDTPAIKAAAVESVDGAYVDGKVGGETWGQILGRDVTVVADRIRGMILLPGWAQSRGTKLECYVNILCGGTFAVYRPAPNTLVKLRGLKTTYKGMMQLLARDTYLVPSSYIRGYL